MFMVNHLTRANDRNRHQQEDEKLRKWPLARNRPILAAGDLQRRRPWTDIARLRPAEHDLRVVDTTITSVEQTSPSPRDLSVRESNPRNSQRVTAG